MVQNSSGFEQPTTGVSGVTTGVVTDRGIADPHYVEHRDYLLAGDRAHPHWGSIFAGIFVALGTLTLLSALGAAVGISLYDPRSDARNWGVGSGIWAIISALIAFAVGGYTAARTTGHNDQKNGLFHGMMVWAVAIPMLAFLLGSGITRLAAGAASNDMTAPMLNTNNGESRQNQGVSADDAKKAATQAAWGTVVSLLLGLGAATLGGYVGARGLPERSGRVAART